MRFLTKTTARRFATFLAALMVVTAGVGIASTGYLGDDAERTADDLSLVQEADAFGIIAGVAAAAIGAGVVTAAYHYLTDDSVSKEKAEEVESAETAQQKADMKSALISQRDSSQNFAKSTNNFVADSRSIASIKAKTRIVEMLNNGTTDTSTISTEVNETIEDYYAVRENNLIAQYQTHLEQLNYTVTVMNNDSSITDDFLYPGSDYAAGDTGGPDGENIVVNSCCGGGYNFSSMTNDSTTLTLTNGSTVDVTLLDITYAHWSYSTNANGIVNNFNDRTYYGLNNSVDNWVSGVSFSTIAVRSIIDSNVTDTGPKTVFNLTLYQNARSDIQAAASDMKANYNKSFITQVAGSYSAGEINTSDLLSPEALASEWSTKYNQTGESVYRWASLSALGLDIPDLVNTSYINLSYEKYTGDRHAVLNISGTSSASDITIDTLGGEVGANQYVVDAPTSGNSTMVRIPAERNTTITISNDTGSVAFDSRPAGKPWLPYVTSGESKTLGGTTITVKDTTKREVVTEPGMIFAQEGPDNGFNVSETYNATSMNGTVYFSPRGENESLQSVKGEFVIKEAFDDDGNSISTLKLRNYNYQTTNVSAIGEQLHALTDFRETVEKHEPTITGGGGLFNLDWNKPFQGRSLVVIVLVGLAALAVVKD
jgi:hypothetical protein